MDKNKFNNINNKYRKVYNIYITNKYINNIIDTFNNLLIKDIFNVINKYIKGENR